MSQLSASCSRRRLEPQTGTAFLLDQGQRLRVIDPLGEQVSDLVAFARRTNGSGFPPGERSTTRIRST